MVIPGRFLVSVSGYDMYIRCAVKMDGAGIRDPDRKRNRNKLRAPYPKSLRMLSLTSPVQAPYV